MISPGASPPSSPSGTPINMQNLYIHSPENVQPLAVNPVPVMLPGLSSGAGAVTVSVPPLPTSDTMVGKNDDVVMSEIKNTAEEEVEYRQHKEIMDHDCGGDDDNSRKRRLNTSMLEEERQLNNEVDMEEIAIAEGKRSLVEEQLLHQNAPKHVSIHDYSPSDIGQSSNASPVRSVLNENDSSPVINQKIVDGELYRDLTFDGMELSSDDKQLIEMVIPNTKEEVLSYDINWSASDKHELHKTMRPWISEKMMDFLKADADVKADRILSSIQEHVCASQMLPMLRVMFRDEAEFFFLDLWTMLIFEIEKGKTVEFVTRIYNAKIKKERFKRAINAPSGGKSGERDQALSVESDNCAGEVNIDKIRDSDSYQDLLNLLKTFDSKMLLEVEQFIDMIPNTKKMLFSYEINWAVSENCELHKKMTPWISKIVKEFLEEDGDVLVRNMVYCIKHHFCASQVLEMVQVMLKDEAELFFLIFWRMLIFEIKKVETVAEFAKRFSNVDCKEERSEVETSNCARGLNEDVIRFSKSYKQLLLLLGLYCRKKRLEIEQFIDTIPKTKENLFSCKINWALFDKYEVHKKMKPWILKKVMEFSKKTEVTTVDCIVTSIKGHAHSSQMVELVKPILDYQAEKFVLKLLRMLIFKIKKVETVELTERIPNSNPKEESSEVATEMNMSAGIMLSKRDREWETRESDREQEVRNFLKLYDPKRANKLKRVREMMPKTKEELFSYRINWDVYDKYALEWSMRQWISREIMDFVGQNDATLVVGYILSSIKDKVTASRMEERLQPILGDESEMFVDDMWRRIIFGTILVLLP